MIKGYCDPKFQNVYDAFSNAITSGFETGAALAIGLVLIGSRRLS